MFSGTRVALVHDWLTGMRGGEKVLEVFADLFPDAPIHTLLHVPGSISAKLEAHPIIPSALQRMPGAAKHYRYYLPLLPRFAEGMRIEPADLVVSVSACVAKGIIPPVGALHASYINSPMRYLYDRYDDYFAADRAGLATRIAMRMVRGRLQRWDRESTDRVDSLVGNSAFIAGRIERCYGRPARVIHPPVDVDRFAQARRLPEDYYLMATALVPYKNVDVAIEAFESLDRRLLVAGSGPLYLKLAAMAPKNVTMLGWVDDTELPALVAGCRAFLMPNVEDFGIAPVEAMAAGRPVIALGEGGVLETVRDLHGVRGRVDDPFGPTGILYESNGPAGLIEAIERFEREENAFDSEQIANWARRFHIDRFRERIIDWLSDVLANGRDTEQILNTSQTSAEVAA